MLFTNTFSYKRLYFLLHFNAKAPRGKAANFCKRLYFLLKNGAYKYHPSASHAELVSVSPFFIKKYFAQRKGVRSKTFLLLLTSALNIALFTIDHSPFTTSSFIGSTALCGTGFVQYYKTSRLPFINSQTGKYPAFGGHVRGSPAGAVPWFHLYTQKHHSAAP